MGRESEVKLTSTRDAGVELLKGFKQGMSKVMKGLEYSTVRKC